MSEDHSFDKLLACPRCDSPLSATANGHHCGGCKVDYPLIDGLPFLFAEPGAALGEWRARLNNELQRLSARAEALERELSNDDLLHLTRDRLTHLRDACIDQRQRLSELMAPLLSDGAPAARETYLALRTRLPTDQGLATYYNNLHRDWSWGSRENQLSHDLVAGMLPDEHARVLVLGSGAGRLSYDLHMSAGDGLTVGLDFNPLLALAGARLSRGEEVSVWEFPIAPRLPEDSAVTHAMKAEPAADGLNFVLGDALRPPFAAGSFDVVVTPWLVDILPVDLRGLAARINRLLKPGGRWINFGSLAFAHPEHAARYSLLECAELVADSGFGEFESREDEMPYMCSPASRHGRLEEVVTWRADKIGDVSKPARYSALPEWLVTGRDPVPALESFRMQAASTRIHAFVMGLIDGKRSIRDMAKLMERERLMQADEALGVIRQFLIKMYDDSRSADLF